MTKLKLAVAAAVASSALVAMPAMADCAGVLSSINSATSQSAKSVHAAIQTAVKNAAEANLGGYGLPMWVTIVDETGTICAITTTPSQGTSAAANQGAGGDWGFTNSALTGLTNPWGRAFSAKQTTSKALKLATGTNASVNGAGNVQWVMSRVISAQKAYTASTLSTDRYAISTANLYTPVKDGSLFGLQHANPVDASIAYDGTVAKFGTATDPLVRQRIGGVNVFGGGLALYKSATGASGSASTSTKVGAIGVSGDTSCRDHAFAWNVRSGLSLANVYTGITKTNVNAAGTAIGTFIPESGSLTGDEMVMDDLGAGNYAGGGNAANANSNATLDGYLHPACANTKAGIPGLIIN